MNLRPEGWKNPYKDTSKHFPFEHCRPVKIACDAYECGADAMLKALKQKGVFLTASQLQLISIDNAPKGGYLILIPEGKETATTTIVNLEE